MKKNIKGLLIVLVTISAVITYTKVFTQDIEEDPFSHCFRYVGDPHKRGNVKDATEAFDLLLNQDNKVIDSIVSTSFLKEKGKPDDYYAPWRANDNNRNTAWVAGKKGGIGEKIYIEITGISVDYFRPLKINFNIINGYAASEELFNLNNRVKKTKLTIYEARWDVCGGFYSTRLSDLAVNNYMIIDLPDTRDAQNIRMKIQKIKSVKKIDKDNEFHSYCFIAELEILEVYKGKKYNDTCISEFNVKDVTDDK